MLNFCLIRLTGLYQQIFLESKEAILKPGDG